MKFSKIKEKAVAVASAFVLVASMMPATALTAFAADPDTTISVTDLASNSDTARYYQIVKQGESGNWELNGTYGSLTIDDILDGINADEAGIIAAAVTGDGTAMTVADNTATANVDPGTYLVIVTPADNDVIYAPMFVSADYDGTSPNSLSAGDSLVAPTVSVAKKTEEDIDKQATGSTDDNNGANTSVAVGSTVNFQVESNIPTFTSNVKDPVFKISDTLTNLTLSGTPQVTVAGYDNLVEGTDYTITTTEKSWEVAFTESFLTTKVTGNPKVTVTYSATVDDTAYNVTELTNEAKIEFTHTPDGETSSKTDETYHYTYSIDGSLNGTSSTEEITKELVKVAVDSEGNPIVAENETVVNGETVTNPLAGAVFKLTGKTNGKEYTATSAADGTISFYGLDAGEYTLVETTAPAGYVLDSSEHSVVITPTFNSDGTLASYTVVIDGKTTSTFTTTHEGETQTFTSTDTDVESFLQNVKNPGLPTTGGMGITLFIAVGVVLMAGAGIVISRGRKKDQAEL